MDGENEFGLSEMEIHFGHFNKFSDQLQSEILVRLPSIGSQFQILNAHIDYTVKDWLVLRGGVFPIPFGEFNEYLYPSFVNKSDFFLLHQKLQFLHGVNWGFRYVEVWS